MLFSELILEARQRLHDIRRYDMVLITSATEDGVRWSSTQLQQVIKGALLEMLRTFRSQKKLKKFINNSVQNRVVAAVIKAGTGLIDPLPSGFYNIERIQLQQKGYIYSELDMKEFVAKDWELSQQASTVVDDLCAIDERWFMGYWDAIDKKIQVKTLPIPAVDTDVTLYLVQQPQELFTISATVDLPFVEVDDIMLDFIEKNAAQIEDNGSQVKLLNDTIELKLKRLGDEL